MSVSLPTTSPRSISRTLHYPENGRAFGIIAGTIGISSAFTACVDCFVYIQFGRHFERDIQTDLLAIGCTRLRLSRWGEAVNIYNDPNLGKPDATATEIQIVKDTLLQIVVLFAHIKRFPENIS